MIYNQVILSSLNNAKDVSVHKVGYIPNVYAEYEWLKWLSFIPEHEASEIKRINEKKVKQLTPKEKKLFFSLDNQKNVASIIKKCIEKDEFDESFIKALNYMENHSLSDLIESKLLPFEIEALDKQVQEYLNGNHDVFKVSLDISASEYMELTMYDAYILHKIALLRNIEENRKENEVFESMLEQNLVMRQKSEINASNVHPCQ